ncbi:CpaF family protein [Caulobacter sp. NIBR2454]|uniref:CpaF family protein n=1 Tax=Caulobacter sp. NIBR2454 TaxID=3015996 RepID=UPI0022B6BC9B|nr:CpaF family protein [Caulobacter sp. NIBR2454]
MNATPARKPPEDMGLTDFYQATKFTIFDAVLEQLDARGLTASSSPSVLREVIETAVHRHSHRENVPLNAAERIRLADDVQHEITGLGPLESLLRDPTIDDVIVNGPHRVYVERGGQLRRAPVRFRDAGHLMNIIQRIVGPIGRRVDEATPYVDARLSDGSRVNVVIPPAALDGPLVSIRKFRAQPLAPADYVRQGAMSAEMLDFLGRAVRSRLNMLICGGTGSGKTTLLGMLSSFIGDTERLITIEDAAELQLRQEHVARMETRPPNVDGTREVSARDLMRNALRMRPDRVILGEVRGAEAVEMLQAMSTGHDGSMATMHANATRDALARLEMLLGFGGLTGDQKTIRRYIASSINLLVQVQRLANGSRRITQIVELTGLEGDNYILNPLFAFEEHPPLSGHGEHRTLSLRPFFAARLVKGGPAGAAS